MNKEYRDYMDSGLKLLGIRIDDNKLEKLYSFYEELIETNKKFNLTNIMDLKEVVYKHFIDSLSIIRIYPRIKDNYMKIIDIGTGAGFPSIPLSICFDKLSIVAIDSLNKRIKFIERIKESLALDNLIALHGRAEDYAHKSIYREKFDIVTSRAVANLSTLSEYCLPFIHIGGSFVAYKSEKLREELEAAQTAIKLLGGKHISTENFMLDNSVRNLINIEKIVFTPKKYPRKAGLPQKEPLL